MLEVLLGAGIMFVWVLVGYVIGVAQKPKEDLTLKPLIEFVDGTLRVVPYPKPDTSKITILPDDKETFNA